MVFICTHCSKKEPEGDCIKKEAEHDRKNKKPRGAGLWSIAEDFGKFVFVRTVDGSNTFILQNSRKLH